MKWALVWVVASVWAFSVADVGAAFVFSAALGVLALLRSGALKWN